VERADVPNIEYELKRKLRVPLYPTGEAMVTRGYSLERIQDIQNRASILYHPGDDYSLENLQGIPRNEWVEQVYSTVDTLLGWNVVPPTRMRITSDGKRVVSAQEFIIGARDLWDIVEEIRHRPGLFNIDTKMFKEALFREVDRKKLQKIALLDLVLGQGDRHMMNVVVDGRGRPWAIDNEAALFNAQTDLKWFYNSIARLFEGEPIPQDLLRDLRRLYKGDFYAALAGIEPHIIESAWNRLQTLIESKRFP